MKYLILIASLVLFSVKTTTQLPGGKRKKTPNRFIRKS